MLIRKSVLKVINNERKILTHQEIIGRIEEKIVSMISQVCKKSKLWIHPYGFIHKFTYISIVDIGPQKKEFC